MGYIKRDLSIFPRMTRGEFRPESLAVMEFILSVMVIELILA